jgi:hypothetical protein
MNGPILVGVRTTVLAIVTIIGAMAAASGCLQAIDWARHAFGDTAVLALAAFIFGVVVTHGVHRAFAARKQPSGPAL